MIFLHYLVIEYSYVFINYIDWCTIWNSTSAKAGLHYPSKESAVLFHKISPGSTLVNMGWLKILVSIIFF